MSKNEKQDKCISVNKLTQPMKTITEGIQESYKNTFSFEEEISNDMNFPRKRKYISIDINP